MTVTERPADDFLAWAVHGRWVARLLLAVETQLAHGVAPEDVAESAIRTCHDVLRRHARVAPDDWRGLYSIGITAGKVIWDLRPPDGVGFAAIGCRLLRRAVRLQASEGHSTFPGVSGLPMLLAAHSQREFADWSTFKWASEWPRSFEFLEPDAPIWELSSSEVRREVEAAFAAENTETGNVLLTIPEAARALTALGRPTKARTLRRGLKNAQAPHTRPGGGWYFVRVEDALRYCLSHLRERPATTCP